MKKQLFGLAVCSCVLLGTSCSNDELVDVITPEQNIAPTYVTATVGADTRLSFDDSEIGTSLKVNWRNEVAKNPETFFGVGFAESKWYKFTQTGELDGKKSKFKVQGYTSSWENAALTEDNNYHLLYPLKNTYDSVFAKTPLIAEVNLPLTHQTGKLAGLEAFNYMTCIATADASDMDIKFKNRISIIRLEKGMQFTGLSGATTVTDITISGTGICSSGNLTMDAANAAGSQDAISLDGLQGDIVTTGVFHIAADGTLAEDVYIAIFPNAAITNFTISAKVGFTDTYELKKTVPFTLQEGELYTMNGDMSFVSSEAKWEGTLDDVVKNSLPTADIWIINDETGTKSIAANLRTNLATAGTGGRAITLIFPNLTTISGQDFLKDGTGLVSVLMPKLEACEKNLFSGCTALKNIYLPILSTPSVNMFLTTSIETIVLGAESAIALTYPGNNVFSGENHVCSNITLSISASEYAANVINCTTWKFGNTKTYKDFKQIISIP